MSYWNRLLVTLIGLALVCCKPQILVGVYQLKYYPKTSINLKEDSTFEFVKINRNPYLHPFDHPDEDYFITRGTWKVNERQLILNSDHVPDSLFTPEVMSSEIINDPSDSIRKCSIFTFYDIFDDTVNVLYAKFPNGSALYRLHRSMEFVEWPIEPGPFDQFTHSDTIEFHFYGYAPYTFIRDDKVSRNVKIRLRPKIKGQVFADQELRISRHAIRNGRMIFRKKK